MARINHYAYPRDRAGSSHSSADPDLRRLSSVSILKLSEQNQKGKAKKPIRLKVKANNKGYSLYIKTEGDDPEIISIINPRKDHTERRLPSRPKTKAFSKQASKEKSQVLPVKAKHEKVRPSPARSLGYNTSTSQSRPLKKAKPQEGYTSYYNSKNPFRQ